MNRISASCNPLPVKSCWNTNLFKSILLTPRLMKIEEEPQGKEIGHACELFKHPR